MDTIFAKIIRKEAAAKFVYEDDLCIAIEDVHPQAPTHVLIIPKKPVERLAFAQPEDQALLGHLLLTAAQIARDNSLEGSGYRVVINNGQDGGETVPHLHVHLLAGRPLKWPPG